MSNLSMGRVLMLSGLVFAASVAFTTSATAADYRQEVARYDEILARDPRNIEALLKSAQLLSWNKRPVDALKRYERALAIDPRNLDALDGKAQVLGWLQAGDLARATLDTALAIDPGRKQALVGLGWTEIWGDRASAVRRINDLERRFPGDPAVVGLRAAAKKAWAPTFRLQGETSDDTGKNSTSVVRADATFMASASQISIKATQRSMKNDISGKSADVTDLTASSTFGVAPGGILTVRGQFAQIKNTLGRERSEFLGGASLDLGSGRRSGLRIEASRDFIAANPLNVDTQSRFQGLTVTGRTRLARAVMFGARVGIGDTSVSGRSETSRQKSLSAGLRYRVSAGVIPIEFGYGVSYLTNSRDLRNEAWMPLKHFSHGPQVQSGGFLPSGFSYFLSASLGIQQSTSDFSGVSVKFKTQASLNLQASFVLPINGPKIGLEFSGSRSDGALSSAGGWTTNTFGTRLIFRR